MSARVSEQDLLGDLLNTCTPKVLREIIDSFGIEYRGDRRRRSDMIDAIANANITVRDLLNSLPDQDIDDLGQLLAQQAGREYKNWTREQVTSFILGSFEIDDTDEDSEEDGNSLHFSPDRPVAANWRDTIWGQVFLAPGKLILWTNYHFPQHGRAIASGRQYGNPLIEVLYALLFWAVAAVFLLIVVTSK